jgi:hypothetical protein
VVEVASKVSNHTKSYLAVEEEVKVSNPNSSRIYLLHLMTSPLAELLDSWSSLVEEAAEQIQSQSTSASSQYPTPIDSSLLPYSSQTARLPS